MSWKTEFSPEWDVPAVIASNGRITDESWHNDAMPFFAVKGVSSNELTLMADHPTVPMRECADGKRFTVYSEVIDAVLLSTDDPHEAVDFLLKVADIISTPAAGAPIGILVSVAATITSEPNRQALAAVRKMRDRYDDYGCWCDNLEHDHRPCGHCLASKVLGGGK